MAGTLPRISIRDELFPGRPKDGAQGERAGEGQEALMPRDKLTAEELDRIRRFIEESDVDEVRPLPEIGTRKP